MNVFTIIYQEDKNLLSFICDNPPSSPNQYFILLTLDNLKTQKIDYYDIYTIVGDRAFKFEDYNKTIDEFMSDFLKVCDGSCKFGVRLYVK